MVTGRKGSAGVDKGRLFEKAVAASTLTQKNAAAAGKTLSQRDTSATVAKAFRTANARTGTFGKRDAKK